MHPHYPTSAFCWSKTSPFGNGYGGKRQAGRDVIGPAGTVAKARPLAASAVFDTAPGHAVGDIAAALTERNIPFAFVSGYGREGLPVGFRDRILLSKPFSPAQLLATVGVLLAQSTMPSETAPKRERATRSVGPPVAAAPSTGALSDVRGYLSDDLRGGARIRAVEFVHISAEGESHERRYEGPAFHDSDCASEFPKTGKVIQSNSNDSRTPTDSPTLAPSFRSRTASASRNPFMLSWSIKRVVID